ncbi:MAG: hypothetical protein ACOCOE_06720 [Prevotella sp.]
MAKATQLHGKSHTTAWQKPHNCIAKATQYRRKANSAVSLVAKRKILCLLFPKTKEKTYFCIKQKKTAATITVFLRHPA